MTARRGRQGYASSGGSDSVHSSAHGSPHPLRIEEPPPAPDPGRSRRNAVFIALLVSTLASGAAVFFAMILVITPCGQALFCFNQGLGALLLAVSVPGTIGYGIALAGIRRGTFRAHVAAVVTSWAYVLTCMTFIALDALPRLLAGGSFLVWLLNMGSLVYVFVPIAWCGTILILLGMARRAGPPPMYDVHGG